MAAVGALEVSGALSAVPHSPQNRSPGSLAEPQAGAGDHQRHAALGAEAAAFAVVSVAIGATHQQA